MPGLRYLQAAVLNRKLSTSLGSRQFSSSGDVTDSDTEGIEGMQVKCSESMQKVLDHLGSKV